jgi:hypothetical protein
VRGGSGGRHDDHDDLVEHLTGDLPDRYRASLRSDWRVVQVLTISAGRVAWRALRIENGERSGSDLALDHVLATGRQGCKISRINCVYVPVAESQVGACWTIITGSAALAATCRRETIRNGYDAHESDRPIPQIQDGSGERGLPF